MWTINEKDKVIWKINKAQYSSKFGYDHLESHAVNAPQNWKWIWKCKVPLKIKYFLWKIKHWIIPTRSLLVERGLQISNKRPWCGITIEDVVHLFWDSYLANMTWSILKEWLGVNLNPLLVNNFCIDRIFSLYTMKGLESTGKSL